MSIEQRKETFLQQLDLSGLEGWSRANHTSTHALLTEYHDVFLLEPGDLGCTSLANHEIWVVDDEPLKERRIPPPKVEEVRAHVKEMLEAGAIHTSKSPWCNAVMLVQKDRALCFCIGLCKLNARSKNRSMGPALIGCPDYDNEVINIFIIMIKR